MNGYGHYIMGALNVREKFCVCKMWCVMAMCDLWCDVRWKQIQLLSEKPAFNQIIFVRPLACAADGLGQPVTKHTKQNGLLFNPLSNPRRQTAYRACSLTNRWTVTTAVTTS